MDQNKKSEEKKVIYTRDFFHYFVTSFVWISILIVFADQMTKWAVFNHFNGRQSITETLIPGFLNLTMTFNQGAFLGMGSGELWARILFICISLIASIAIIVVYLKKKDEIKPIYRFILSFVLGGCVGNLIDRAFYWEGITGFSGVIDFLTFAPLPNGQVLFGIWNVADAMIVFSIVCIVVEFIVEIIKDAVEKSKIVENKTSNSNDDLPIDFEEKEKIENNELNKNENIDDDIKIENEDSIKSENAALTNLLSKTKKPSDEPKKEKKPKTKKVDNDKPKKKNGKK